MRLMSAKSAAVALAVVFAATSSSRVGAQNPNAAANANANSQVAQGPDVEIEGTLEAFVEDDFGGSTIHQFLITAQGRIRLKEKSGNAELFGLTTGSQIKVRGKKNQNNTELELAGGTGGSVTTVALAAPNTFGQQRTVVIMVNFQDDTSSPTNFTDASNVTFDQVNDYFRANSYGQTSITGDVFGTFTIAMSGSVCDVNQLASLADSAASNAGVNLNNYTRRVYSFPRNACTWWGLGTVGGNPSRAWIKGTYSLKVVAHELGHNFGDYHSNSMSCAAGTCTATEYGDDRDMMGQSGTGHFHAYQKERLGWLNYGSSPAIQQVTSSGTYWIGNYETGAAPSALKVLKVAASSSDQTFYYIEARAQNDFDAPYAPGVILHTGNSSNGNSAYEVDVDPDSSTFDSLLDPGQTFTDAAAGFSVTTISSDASGAWVSITYAGTPCSTGTPTVTLSPGSTITTPGAAANYTMTVKNNDGASCGSAGFGIDMAVPSGWTWSAAQPSISVAPGSTINTSVSVTPPVGASGSSSVNAMAARTSAGPSGSGAATLTVASGVTLSLNISGGSQPSMTATVTAGSAPVAGAVVRFTITDPKGAVTSLSGTTNSSGIVTVKDRLKGKDPHGTYSVRATVTSGSLSGSASGTFVY